MVRHKNRYIVVEINPQQQRKDDSLSINPTSLHSSILKKIQQLHGDFGIAASRAGFTSKYCNEKTRIAVIKARHGPHKLVGSALSCINTVDNKRVSLNTLYTGATMRQCFKFIMYYQRRKVDEACATLKNEDEKNTLREAFMNLDSVREIT